jgi:hypothetical protein
MTTTAAPRRMRCHRLVGRALPVPGSSPAADEVGMRSVMDLDTVDEAESMDVALGGGASWTWRASSFRWSAASEPRSCRLSSAADH